MAVSFVVELEITNQAAVEPYRTAVGATIEQYGGRFLARAGATELIEGGPEPKRIFIPTAQRSAASMTRSTSGAALRFSPDTLRVRRISSRHAWFPIATPGLTLRRRAVRDGLHRVL